VYSVVSLGRLFTWNTEAKLWHACEDLMNVILAVMYASKHVSFNSVARSSSDVIIDHVVRRRSRDMMTLLSFRLFALRLAFSVAVIIPKNMLIDVVFYFSRRLLLTAILTFGTHSLQLFECVPAPTLFVVILRLAVSSRPSNSLIKRLCSCASGSVSLGFCWPLSQCAFIDYIYTYLLPASPVDVIV